MYFNKNFIICLFTIALFSYGMEQGDLSQQSSFEAHLPQYICPTLLQYSEDEIRSLTSLGYVRHTPSSIDIIDPSSHCEICGYKENRQVKFLHHLNPRITRTHLEEHAQALHLIKNTFMFNVKRIYTDKNGAVCISGTL